jgi:radical SAM protein with 4Fe4S-binding SPASM domain
MIRNLTKPANLFLAGYTYLRSTVTGNPEVAAMPISVGVELTNNCNLKCTECITGSGLMKRGKGFMPVSLYNRILSELSYYLLNVNLYFQGEPLLHPDIVSFITASRGIYSVISTNGHYLSEEKSYDIVKSGLKKIIISLDGLDQETYNAYRRNGDIKKVIKGIENLAEAKKKMMSSMTIEIQVLVNRLNENQVPGLKKLASKYGASLRLKSMQVLDEKKAALWMPAEKRYRRYKLSSDGYKLRNKLPDHCARMWFSPVITWDGNVIPCCFDKNAEHIMGNLYNQSFRDIWEGTKYRLFRKSVLTDRGMIDICRNCTSGIKGVKT